MKNTENKLELWLGEHTVYITAAGLDNISEKLNMAEDKCVFVALDNEKYHLKKTYKRPFFKFGWKGHRYEVGKKNRQKLRDEIAKVKEGNDGHFQIGVRAIGAWFKKELQ